MLPLNVLGRGGLAAMRRQHEPEEAGWGSSCSAVQQRPFWLLTAAHITLPACSSSPVSVAVKAHLWELQSAADELVGQVVDLQGLTGACSNSHGHQVVPQPLQVGLAACRQRVEAPLDADDVQPRCCGSLLFGVLRCRLYMQRWPSVYADAHLHTLGCCT